MTKKYIISQLTRISAWTGAAVILSAALLPTFVTVLLGLLLILTPDEKLQAWIKKASPKIREILEQE
jgi:UPF0716 family protein affecting phage T7 exclusion